MKAGFQSCLDVRLKDGSDNVWILDSPLKYFSERLNQMIVVPPWYELQSESSQEGEEPAKFYTDLASVPRVPVFYVMWGSRAHREAVLHDYLYRCDSVPVVAKSEADSCFLEAMASTGKPFYVRWPMYWGVVLGGGGSYHKKKVRDAL